LGVSRDYGSSKASVDLDQATLGAEKLIVGRVSLEPATCMEGKKAPHVEILREGPVFVPPREKLLLAVCRLAESTQKNRGPL
jgi:hypothetical protein